MTSRFRPAGNLGTILTIRIPELPSLDVFAYAVGTNGEALDNNGQMGVETVKDGAILLDSVFQAGGNNLVEHYQGALRVIKMWAIRRGVYGASTGFLGGGSWAVWLASVVLDEIQEAASSSRNGMMSSHEMVHCFFRRASKIRWGDVVTLQKTTTANPLDVTRRRVVSIMAPSCQQTCLTSRSTPSTWATILREIHHAAILADSAPLVSVFSVPPVTMPALVSTCPTGVVLLDVKAQDGRRGEVKAWGNQQFVWVLVELEKLVDGASDGELFRPLATPSRHFLSDGAVSFSWMIGIQDPAASVTCPSSSLPQKVALAIGSIGGNLRLNQEARSRFGDATVAVRCQVRFPC